MRVSKFVMNAQKDSTVKKVALNQLLAQHHQNAKRVLIKTSD